MGTNKRESLEKRLEKLKSEKQVLKEKLKSLQHENLQLSRSLRNQNRLFDLNPTGIVLIQDGKVLAVNETALNPLSYRVEEVLGRTFLDLFKPELRPYLSSLYQKRASGKPTPMRYEAEMVTKNGDAYPCEVWVKKIRFNGRNAFLFNSVPIAQRKKKENETIFAKKREALATMSAGLFYQLKQSVNNIDEKGFPSGYEDVKAALDQMSQTTQNLSRIAGTEPDAAKMERFNLNDIVEDAVSLVDLNPENEPVSRQGDIRLKTYLRSASPLIGDPEEIKDVIVQTVTNAVEAMPEGGDLYLTTEENGGHAHIYIQDSGSGIPENLLDRIFDPFFTTKGDGRAGIGLSLTYAAIKKYDGEIEVASRERQGTTFEIKLPLAKRDEKAVKGLPRRSAKNARILILEDEDILGELLTQFLTSKGYRVFRADNGSDGLEKLKKKEFDLVLVNPGIAPSSAATFIKKIRKARRNIPVAFLKKADVNLSPALRRSVDLEIDIPIDMNRLVKQISEVLVQKAKVGHER
ncbi:ATP-binding protein [Thermodesulfobacteriota bacterium]